MKRIIVLMVMLAMGVGVHAQRPVGDTINVGEGDYRYDTAHRAGLFYISSGIHCYYDYASLSFVFDILDRMPYPDVNPGYFDEILLQRTYPDLWYNGSHIAGQQFCLSRDEEIRVIGVAVCPLVNPQLEDNIDSSWYQGIWVVPILDTTMAGRLTEYMQLYTVDAGNRTLRLKAEGPWRWEDPHRYLQFPHYYAWRDTLDENSNPSREFILIDSTIVTPLYEVMFDTGVVIRDSAFVIAGTYYNNKYSLYDSASDDYRLRRIVFRTHDHLPTCYTACFVREMPSFHDNTLCLPFPDLAIIDSLPFYRELWMKYDTLPWKCLNSWDLGRYCNDSPFWSDKPYWVYNFFPILDTLWGTPCGAVTGMQSVVIDSSTAMVMWSSDARHHRWEVSFFPSDDPHGGTVVDVESPLVTLSNLTPGREYGVTVRGLCYEKDYSPWGDTLLFTMPQDTAAIDTNGGDTTHTQGIRRLSNLDRFTQLTPNPASVAVRVFSSYRLQSVVLYDLQGRPVLEQKAEGLFATVDVSALSRGTYIAAISTPQGIATKKLILK